MGAESPSAGGSTALAATVGSNLAKWSWLCFLICFGANFIGRATGIRVPAEVLGLAVMLIGIGLAIGALVRIPSDGRRGVMVPALVGLVLNGLFVFVWVTNFLTSYARARGRG